MNQSQSTKGIILARKDIGEADRLLSMFTDKLGKIRVVARGSRRIKSKMASHIEPFTVGLYQIVEGKTFYILTGAEKILYFDSPTNDLELYKEASYICELVDIAFQENESNLAIYDLLFESLRCLQKLEPAKRQIVVRYFELRLLSALGYKPNFRICKKCQKDIPEKDHYIGGFEGIVCPDCKSSGKRMDKNFLKSVKAMQDMDLDKVLRIKGIDSYGLQLREMFQPYLFEIIPRQPRSLEL